VREGEEEDIELDLFDANGKREAGKR